MRDRLDGDLVDAIGVSGGAGDQDCRSRSRWSSFVGNRFLIGGMYIANNRDVVYPKPGVVEVQSIDFPRLILGNRNCTHGVILKIVLTNICTAINTCAD